MIPVAFAHRRRVGKDTASNFLLTHLRLNGHRKAYRVSFAQKMKQYCYELYGWSGLQQPEFYEREENAILREIALQPIGKSPREIWIEFGMAGRAIYENTWIDLLFTSQKNADVLIIGDCRFLNEVNRIKEYGGAVIKIDRPGIEVSNDVADSALADYTDWDAVITNDGDLKNLHKQVIDLTTKIKGLSIE